jgi:hypothetical protein
MYPADEEIINEQLQIADDFSEKSHVTYEVFSELLNEELSMDVTEREDEKLMANLEVTLFKDFPKIVKLLSKMSSNKKLSSEELNSGLTFKKQLLFVQEVIVLIFIASFLMFIVVQGNKYYEKNLASRISLYQPDFFWLDTSLSYKEKSKGNVDVKIKELNLVEDKAQELKIDTDEFRYETESEMVIASVDAIPQNLGSADFEESKFEEKTKGGYRDSRFGRTRAYRVMMVSDSPKELKIKINDLSKTFQAKPVGEVKPGTAIPGGIYYNLFVPTNNLKDFLAKVEKLDNVTIFESRSRRGAPRGLRKVFIWIKGI